MPNFKAQFGGGPGGGGGFNFNNFGGSSGFGGPGSSAGRTGPSDLFPKETSNVGKDTGYDRMPYALYLIDDLTSNCFVQNICCFMRQCDAFNNCC